YLEGYDLRRVSLEQRKKVLETIVVSPDLVRYSDHQVGEGTALFEVARQKGLEGIVAKRRTSCYEERRSREWLKIKITHTVDCVKPELVAEVKYSEWTHETAEGGLKLRAPVFMGLRTDKSPQECTFEEQKELQ